MEEKKEKYKIKKVGQYYLLKEIGSGTSATVYKAKIEKQIENNGKIEKMYETFAVKMIPVQKLNEKSLKRVQQEIDILTKLEHKNIVKIIDYKKSENHWYLVFEHCKYGDLDQYIKKYCDGKLTERKVQQVIQQLAPALKLMQEMNIVHRDLKLANIMVDKNFIVKIGDFGFANIYDNNSLMKTTLGTPITMGPEVLQGYKYNEKCDIWSLGIIIYQMVFGKPPFLPPPGSGITGLKLMINKGYIEFDVKNIEISQQLQDLIKKMLVKDPEKRIDFQQFFNHPWVSGQFFVKQNEELDLNISLKKVKEQKEQLENNENENQLIINNKNIIPEFNQYEAILMMKVSFTLRKFLEKTVVGFLAGCNSLKQLFQIQTDNIQIKKCIILSKIILATRLNNFIKSKLCLEFQNKQIIIPSYNKFAGFFLEKGENDNNNFGNILQKKLDDYCKTIQENLDIFQQSCQNSSEYLLMQTLLQLSLTITEENEQFLVQNLNFVQGISNIFNKINLSSTFLSMEIQSKKIDQLTIEQICDDFQRGKFLKMTKYLLNPKLYNQYKNYEDLFNVNILENQEEVSDDKKQIAELYSKLQEIVNQIIKSL